MFSDLGPLDWKFMSRLARVKFCRVYSGFWQCYKLIINYILQLHVKSFILAGQDPCFPCFFHVIASDGRGFQVRMQKKKKKFGPQYLKNFYFFVQKKLLVFHLLLFIEKYKLALSYK